MLWPSLTIRISHEIRAKYSIRHLYLRAIQFAFFTVICVFQDAYQLKLPLRFQTMLSGEVLTELILEIFMVI